MGVLRFLLAVSVVISHCGSFFGLDFVGGLLAVQAFFIISGFYMALILNEKYIGVNNSYSLFITNRLARLYPIYWVVLIFTILGCVGKMAATHGTNMGVFSIYLLVKFNFLSFAYFIFTNLLIFGQDLVMFLGINPTNGSLFFTSNFRNSSPLVHYFMFEPQAWSLGIELSFYLIAPFLLRRSLKVIVTGIVISLCLRLYLYNYVGLHADPWTSRFFPTELIFFLLGYISYKIYLKIKNRLIPSYINMLFFIGMILLVSLFSFIPVVSFKYTHFSLKEIIFLFYIVIAIPVLFNFLKKNTFDIKIGDLSYPIYISHFFIIFCCKALPFEFMKQTWVMLLFTLIFSYILNIFIANPIEKYRQARLKTSTAN